jgi:hypothetical protein
MPKTLADNELFVDFDEPSSMWDSNGRALTKMQVNFFQQSKCLGEDGDLLVVYHASNSDFTTFDTKRIGSGGGSIYGKGFYFCDSDVGLDIYGKYIKEYYLNLKNPFRWEAIEEEADASYNIDMFIEVLEQNNFSVSEELRQQLEEEVYENDGGLDTVIEQTCGFGLAQKYFIRAGYDGIMNLSIGDYVAFNPKQIKLCSNKTPTNTANIAA